MTSSTSSSKHLPPLFDDLLRQRARLRSWILASGAFILLFLIADRVVGHILLKGLERYYGLDVPAKVLLIGHSHTVLGLDKVVLEDLLGVPVAKFALEGANTTDRDAMIGFYLTKHPGSVRAVVYDVSAHTFTSRGLSSNSYRLLFPFMADSGIRDYVRQHCHTALEYWIRRILLTPRFNEERMALSVRGYLQNWSNYKRGQVDIDRLKSEISKGIHRRIEIDPQNQQIFVKTLTFVSSRDIAMVLLYIPTVDVLNQAEPQQHRLAVSVLKDLAQATGAIYLDYNSDYETRHELFYDPIHLNRDGRQAITQRLAADLQRLLNGELKPGKNGKAVHMARDIPAATVSTNRSVE